MTRYLVSLQFVLGTTTLISVLILFQKTASTLPCPFFLVLSSAPPFECFVVAVIGRLTLSLLVDPQSKSMSTQAPAI